MNIWHEEQHPRNAGGEFTHASVGAWAKAAAEQLGNRRAGIKDPSVGQQHPPGWGSAKGRHEDLWDVPTSVKEGGMGRERTDAEQDELDALERAFDTYRRELGLQHSGLSGLLYEDRQGNTFTQHGENLGKNIRSDPPPALRMGYTRVGDHPEGEGSIEASETSYLPRSTHPQAGGLWIDPKRPGTRHEPNYLNDWGHGVSSLRKDPSPSQRRKDVVVGRRRGENRTYLVGRIADQRGGEVQHYVHRGLGRFEEREGTFGYGARGARGASGTDEHAGVFVAAMKRARKRASVEGSARRARRRTPRGTAVEGWMNQASRQLDQRIGRG